MWKAAGLVLIAALGCGGQGAMTPSDAAGGGPGSGGLDAGSTGGGGRDWSRVDALLLSGGADVIFDAIRRGELAPLIREQL